MGRSPSITVGDATEGVRVEHVKSRGLVRLTRWPGGAKDDAVGLQVSDFCARLGITTDVLGLTRRYLLVGDPARVGSAPVVALFATEGEARAEFVRFRRAVPAGGAWAEVTEITTGGDMRRICWFGSSEPSRRSAPPEQNSRRRPGVRVTMTRWFTGGDRWSDDRVRTGSADPERPAGRSPRS